MLYDLNEEVETINEPTSQYNSNVAEVQHVQMIELPDIKDLTPEQRPGLKEINSLGQQFLRLPGHEKTFHKDFLLLAQVAYLRGETAMALRLARRSLELHPYYPNAFAFLAAVLREDDPERAEQYWATYDYIMNQATHGFRRTYPELPDPDDS